MYRILLRSPRVAERTACLPAEGDSRSRAQTPAEGAGREQSKNQGLPAHSWFHKDMNRRPPLTYPCPKNSNLIKTKGENGVSRNGAMRHVPGRWQPHPANGTWLRGNLAEATRSQNQEGSQDHCEAERGFYSLPTEAHARHCEPGAPGRSPALITTKLLTDLISLITRLPSPETIRSNK